MPTHARFHSLAVAIGAALIALPASTRAANPQSAAQHAAIHDGQHDFDYLLGSWKIHLRRRLNPLTGSNRWVEFDGTVVCRKIWAGRGELEQFDVDNPEKHIVIHGLTIRLYDRDSGQWHIYWSNADKGTIDWPPMEGHFTAGRGEFYDQEDHDGKLVLVRFIWTRTNTQSPHFEQSFSGDWGKTWEVNWITDQTKQ